MRTLTFTIPFPFEMWLIDWAYNTLVNDYVGLGVVGLLLLNVVILSWAIVTDWNDDQIPLSKGWRAKKRQREEDLE